MRARRVARWVAGLVAVAAFGVAGVSSASADEVAQQSTDGPTTHADAWD